MFGFSDFLVMLTYAHKFDFLDLEMQEIKRNKSCGKKMVVGLVS